MDIAMFYKFYRQTDRQQHNTGIIDEENLLFTKVLSECQ